MEYYSPVKKECVSVSSNEADNEESVISDCKSFFVLKKKDNSFCLPGNGSELESKQDYFS